MCFINIKINLVNHSFYCRCELNFHCNKTIMSYYKVTIVHGYNRMLFMKIINSKRTTKVKYLIELE